jgi:hypothetical protein
MSDDHNIGKHQDQGHKCSLNLLTYYKGSVTKNRESVRKKHRKRNTDAHSQGTHVDPNGIRAAWFSDMHQICHSNNSQNKHTHALIFELKMIYSYLDQHIGSHNADPCALHRIK